MVHLIPPPLHRTLLRAAHRMRRAWWRWRKPVITGCRVLAFDEAGRVLLIRQSYGKPVWLLPAGGMRRGEDPVLAAARELREETACALVEACFLEVVIEPVAGTANHVHVVAGRAVGTPRPDAREVVEARFFALDALPAPLATALPAGLPRWVDLHRRLCA